VALVLTDMVDLLIVTDEKDLIPLAWDVAEASEMSVLLVEVMFTVTGSSLFSKLLEVVEEGVSIHAATSEAIIIFKPVDGADLADMARALHVLWAFSRVEVEDVDCALTNGTCEEMTSITELDLLAGLQLEGWWVLSDGLRQDVEELDVVADRNHEVEATGMQSDGFELVTGWAHVLDVELAVCVIPNVDETLGASGDKRLSQTDIHTCDFLLVER